MICTRHRKHSSPNATSWLDYKMLGRIHPNGTFKICICQFEGVFGEPWKGNIGTFHVKKKTTRGLSRGRKKIISDSTWWRSSLRFDLENLEFWSGGCMQRSILLYFKGLRNLTNKNICCNCEFIDKTFVSSQNWQVYHCLPLLCLVLCPVFLSFVQYCCFLSSIVVLCPVLLSFFGIVLCPLY